MFLLGGFIVSKERVMHHFVVDEYVGIQKEFHGNSGLLLPTKSWQLSGGSRFSENVNGHIAQSPLAGRDVGVVQM